MREMKVERIAGLERELKRVRERSIWLTRHGTGLEAQREIGKCTQRCLEINRELEQLGALVER